jgi:hypothetical protein
MTTIYVYDSQGDDSASAKLTPLPMAGLVIAAWNLLDQAADLAQPYDISVSDTQHMMLQFPPVPASARAITQWALRFGGVLSSEPHQTERGPQVWYRDEFDYYGVKVMAFAHIPADTGPAVI